jgi:CO/xanthine dehydrogenase FAD-binding subunit
MRELIDGACPGATGLGPGEFLVQIATDQVYASAPHAFVKRTRASKVDYPLLSIAAIKVGGRIRVAFSGLCAGPFRSIEIEDALNSPQLSPECRIDQALRRLPSPVVDDIMGSAAYRQFVLRVVLEDIIAELGGVS